MIHRFDSGKRRRHPRAHPSGSDLCGPRGFRTTTLSVDSPPGTRCSWRAEREVTLAALRLLSVPIGLEAKTYARVADRSNFSWQC
jgi:hypothetical protein